MGGTFTGVSKGGARGAIAPPLFGRIEGAAGGGATPHYYVYYYLPPHFYEATYAPVYDILPIFDQSWKKKEEEEDRKVL